MAVKHATASTRAASGYTGKIGPVDWNADHVIGADSIDSATMVAACLDSTHLKGGYPTGLVTGLVPVTYQLTNTSGGTGDVALGATGCVRLTQAFIAFDVWVLKNANAGTAAQTVTLLNDSDAMTDAIDIDKPAGTVVRAGLLVPAQQTVLSGSYMRLRRTYTSGDSGCSVFVSGVVYTS